MSAISVIIDNLNYSALESKYYYSKLKKAGHEIDKRAYLALANYYEGKREAYLTALDNLGVELDTHISSATFDDVGTVEYAQFVEALPF